jgi:putative two-component system response regulator
MGKDMLKDRFTVYPVPSGEKLFVLLEKVTPDIILLDVEMPEMNGYEVLKKLKERQNLADIPVIFLTAKNDTRSELEGLTLGAVDYVAKPFSPPLLLKRIENHLELASQKRELKEFNENLLVLVERKSAELVALQNSMLVSISDLVEFRDGTTGGHIARTQNYIHYMLKAMVENKIYSDIVDSWDLQLIALSSPLHDVGKIAISDTILNKPGKLTAEEFEIMKKHTTFGVSAIEEMQKTTRNQALEQAKIFAGTHHEKWDGTGYPAGLKGEGIPLQGRLMAVADVYDALISARPYKPPMPYEKAKQIIADGKGTHFDPILVDLFFSLSDDFEAIAQTPHTICDAFASAG